MNRKDMHSGHEVTEVRKDEIGKAFSHLVGGNLKWGARIVSSAPDRIIVETQVLDCLDRDEYFGTPEEMKALYDFVTLYQASDVYNDEVRVQCVEESKGMSQPFVFLLAAPGILGGAKLKVALMLSIGIRAKEYISYALKMRLDDVVACVQLVHDGSATADQAFALLTNQAA